MLKSMTFRSTLAAVACALSLSAHAMADSPKKVEIAAGDLRPALLQLSRAYGVELLYQPSQLDHFRTAGIRGDYTPEAAVRLLLKGTPLELRTDPSGAMMVVDPKAPHAAAVSTLSDQATAATPGSADASQPPRSLQLAQANPGTSAGPVPVVVTKDTVAIQEVIVTAQKREERLQDVPVPVTALAAETLSETNQTGLQDYFSKVPGLTMTTAIGGNPAIVIRGVTTGGYGNPTVGIAIDDIPYGFSTAQGGGYQAPDFDPGELQRVEVLRGPQGTLYGASSLGGLLKYVTIDPSTDGINGRVQAGTNSVYNATGQGYDMHGAINVPVTDGLALRASIFTRHDAGYIDDPLHHIDGINWGDAYGGQVSALWKPTSDVSIKLFALLQDSKTNAAPDVGGALPGADGDLQTSSYLPNSGGWESRDWLFGATINAKLGSGELTSVTGYSERDFLNRVNFATLSSLAIPRFGPGRGIPYENPQNGEKFSQEIRFVLPLGPRVDWLIGGFYTHEHSVVEENIYAADFNTGEVLGTLVATHEGPTIYQEYAGFTDFTVHVTDRFDVQLGGRESKNKQSYQQTQFVEIVPPGSESVGPTQDSDASAFTYLFTPRLRITPDVMVYGRIASGYRVGGPNYNIQVPGVPPSFGPDKTVNYEVGTKGSAFQHTFTFDASVYYIDWKDIQIREVAPPPAIAAFIANAGAAKSQGVELSLGWIPLRDLTIDAWAAYNDAVLTKGFPPGAGLAQGESGDRLPYSSRFSGYFAVTQEFPFVTRTTGFANASINYIGDRLSDFVTAPATRQSLPGYARVDALLGVKRDSWKVNVYVNNLTDRRGVIAADTYAGTLTIIQPRTIGVNLLGTF